MAAMPFVRRLAVHLRPARRSTSAPAVASICLAALIAGCATHRPPSRIADADAGRVQFQNLCAACHQYDGQGMGDAPPLAGSPWVTGPESRLIRIVLHGVRGPMEIAGKAYDQEMPGFGKVLSDANVASLLSFVRARFATPGEPITPSTVARIRAASPDRTNYWTAKELLDQP